MTLTINITDSVSPLLSAWRNELTPGLLHPHIARAEERLFKDHIGKLPKNKLGKSTGFWAAAVRGTHAEATPDGCLVSINKQGFRQRYAGGEIKPLSPDGWLTIPARSEFYGARAREFTNLRFILFRTGTAALVINDGGSEKITGLKSTRKAGGKKSAGMIAFWLVKSVFQKPDPGVIPPVSDIIATARDAVKNALERARRRLS